MFNHVKIEFPNSPEQLVRVFKATYYQQNYQHDYAQVFFRDWNVSFKRVKPGTPMRMKIDSKEFVGYVHDVKNEQNNNQNFTKVTFIGASYVMRQARQKIYYNVTADQVVTEIAKKYGFAYKAVPHPRVYPQISQAGLTDWELMVKLAKQSGYFLRAENTAIYFQPLLKDFYDMLPEATAFKKADRGIKTVNPLYSFRPTIGETLAHHGADKSATSVAGIDPRTGQYFKYTKPRRTPTTRRISQPEFFDKHATEVVVNDPRTAISEANSADDKSSFPYLAEVEVIGTSTLRPGMPVYIDNVGAEYSGYWSILRVEHKVIEERLNTQMFTTVLFLGTDSLGELNVPGRPAKPTGKPKRNIILNRRNTRVKPNSVLRRKTINVKPVSVVSLVDRINRNNETGTLVSQAVWISDMGDLNISTPSQVPTSIATERAAAHLARACGC